ncbi:MAG: ceramidase domain-containing protein, partial [Pseudomonadota bacterium]
AGNPRRFLALCAQAAKRRMVVGWQEQMDNYCERTDLTFWSEPLNAITNAAFLIAALVVFLILRRDGRMDWGLGLSLLVLTAIGIGSFLFHTFATRWASTADVTPILLYIMVYLYHIGTRLFDLRWWWGLAMALGFIPYSFVVVSALQPVVGSLNGSIAYMPVPIGLLIFAGLLWGKRPEVAKGFLIGIAILCLSLFARTVDEALCTAFPVGTHIFWHILNGIMLGWMILVMGRATEPKGA